MRPLLRKLKPANGIAYFLHFGLVLVLPVAVFILVRLNFIQLAISIVILSKWRIFAVRPRFWAANVRANAVDLMVGLSIIVFMVQSSSAVLQIGWALIYAIWLIAIKPRSSILWVCLQAGLAQIAAISALYAAWANGPVFALTLLTGLFCFFAARHFFDIFEEPYARLLSYGWGYFGAALAWLLSHWLLFYGVIAQATLLISVIGYGLAGLYYLDHYDRLSKGLRRQMIFIMMAVVSVVLFLSDWGDKRI
jgi:hypothetical protein